MKKKAPSSFAEYVAAINRGVGEIAKRHYECLAMDAFQERCGLNLPWGGRRRGKEGSEPDWGTPDEAITATVDARAFADAKREALVVHRSQVDVNHFFLRMPPPLWVEAMGTEYYRLVRGQRGPGSGEDGWEDDLFAGLGL